MSRRSLGVFAGVLAALWFVPRLGSIVTFPVFYLIFLYSLFFWITQATSWNILTGYSGYFSFGQGAFFGVGVYSSAILTARFDANFFLTIPVAGLVATALAAFIGLLAFRLRALRGEIFALLTLAVTFVMAALAGVSSFIDGGQGRRVSVPEYPSFLGDAYPEFIYRVGLVMMVGSLVLAYAIQHSRFGKGLFAIRDDEDVAESLGVPTLRLKMLVLALSGFLAGAAGGIHSLQIGYVTTGETFSFEVPLFVILMSVLGGRSHWLGPVIGATLVYTLRDRLAGQGFEDISQIVLGGVLILAIVFAPQGLYTRLRSRIRLVSLVALAVAAFQVVTGSGGAPLNQAMIIMLVVLPVALVPARTLPTRGWFRPRTEHGMREGVSPRDPGSQAGFAGSPTVAVSGSDDSDPVFSADAAVLVSCEGVHKDFDGIHALRGVDMAITRGEVVGLVGPNGSGKSTLVNVLTGVYVPTAGRIRFHGEDITGRDPHVISDMGMARTYQIPRPFGAMTVFDNVALACMFRRERMSLVEAKEAAWEYLEFTGLDAVAGALPDQINLHQRKFLELTRALASEPDVLMLDEVLSGLNPHEIDESAEMIRRVHAQGTTLVIVEHIMRVVTQLATRIVVLNQGTVLADGLPDEVMQAPEVVEAYLGRESA